MAVDVAPLPSAGASGLPALVEVFEQADLTDLVPTTIDVTLGFPDFRDEIPQRQIQQFDGGFVRGKAPRVLMILRSSR